MQKKHIDVSMRKMKNEYLQAKNEMRGGGGLREAYFSKLHDMFKILLDCQSVMADSSIIKIEINHKNIEMTDDHQIKYVVNMDDVHAVPFWMLATNDYDKTEIGIVLRLLNDGDIFFDIGANIGLYSLLVAKQKPDCKILSFEPMPVTFANLKSNIALNNLDNIQAFPIALWKENEQLKFHFTKSSTPSSSVAKLYDDAEEIIVDGVKLDDFFARNYFDKIDLMKIDVEGAELMALQGAKEMLKRFSPIVFAELFRGWSEKLGYNHNQTLSYMKQLGYCCFELRENFLLPFEEMTEETIGYNFFFLHTEKHRGIISNWLEQVK
jgi:FkbM family methyltransferase